MDPFYAGLIIGFLFGSVGGVFVLALVSFNGSQEMEQDAARFRALELSSTPAINEDGRARPLRVCADELIAQKKVVYN